MPGRSLVYIGDSEVDWELASRAAVPGVLVTWGLRSRAELEVRDGAVRSDTVDELKEAIDGI